MPAVVTKSDMIAQQVLLKFSSLKGACNIDLGRVVLAGFVLENEDSYTVVSIGTGKCLAEVTSYHNHIIS